MGVGIDVGSKTIKVIDLERAGNVWVLSGSGVVAYQGNSIESIEDEKELSQIAQVIRKLHNDARISKRHVVVSIPEQYVFTRTIRFPMLTDQEIAAAVKWEAEQYVPIPINEAVVQHTILERNEKATPPQVVILLVAAPVILVEKYLKLFQMAGLTIDSIESEMLALVRSLAPENQTSIIVDFGSKTTDIGIAKNKNLFFAKSLPTAGDALTRMLTQSLQVEEAQAEEYKKSYGLAKNLLEGKIEQLLSPILKGIIEEIRKTIHFYQTEERGEVPKTLILSGGSSGLTDLIPFIARELSMEVIIGNPFGGVKLDSQAAKTIANYSPLYSISVGLAQKEV